MTRYYIAGPMSGLPDSNYPAFDRVASEYRALGHHVENPAENAPPVCGTWEGWMRKAIAQLVTCERVVFLPGWEKSRGAMEEARIASLLKIEHVYLNTDAV